MKPLLANGGALALAFGLAVSGIARAEPVVYTLHAVTDGKLGSQAFSQAQVVLTFRGDTRNVTIQTESGGVVYRNDQGEATVALIQDGKKSLAHIAAGQIYVRYDTTNGVVGFGSLATGPTYPLALSCQTAIYAITDCFGENGYTQHAEYSHADQIVSALADTNQSILYSFSSALPTSLTDSTLLTGYVSACAAGYPINSYICPSPPAVPIRTDLGDFYLQDQGYQDKGIFTVVVVKEEDAEGK
ncbi:hypothetical protein [Cupriavidus sp. D39]|uniref:hypothetical protein n=1 Tax=Cupriavidus sp. D39 TaxID=2997877 RepID=UPI00226FAB0B|nr:hypothetical protein [Cupriavidus sp. D39]MCY0855024.1 hypothetical protein [Cupriavidus sp. D39]